MESEFFDVRENLADLVTHMPDEDQHRFHKYGHMRIEPAFIDRQFIVYKPQGLNKGGQHNPPEILNVIRIVDFSVDARNGCQVVLKEEQTQQELAVGHVPRRVYGYPVYMAVPARVEVRWDGRRLENGRVWRSLSFAVLVKTKNKSDFYSLGNTYVETPNEFNRLFPNAGPLQLKV